MKKYCEECGKEVEAKIITRKEIYDVCGEPIEVDAQLLVCIECGEELLTQASSSGGNKEAKRAVEISKYSYKEVGYQATNPGEITSYSFAKDINLD